MMATTFTNRINFGVEEIDAMCVSMIMIAVDKDRSWL